MIARALARLDGDDLVLTMRDGAVHSRIPVDDTMDPAEALERLSEGTMPVRLLWSLLRTTVLLSPRPGTIPGCETA